MNFSLTQRRKGKCFKSSIWEFYTSIQPYPLFQIKIFRSLRSTTLSRVKKRRTKSKSARVQRTTKSTQHHTQHENRGRSCRSPHHYSHDKPNGNAQDSSPKNRRAATFDYRFDLSKHYHL